MKERRIRLRLEWDGKSAEIEGSVDEVFKEVVKLLNLESLSRLVYTPDASKLIEDLTGMMTLTSDGILLTQTSKLSSEEGISLCLMGSYIGKKLGIYTDDSLPVEDLAKFTGKDVKTIRNTLPNMLRSGFVERIERGKYRVTAMGIKKLSEEVLPVIREKLL